MQVFIADGFLANDPEQYLSENGELFAANFNLAIRSGFGDNSRTDFFPVVAYNNVGKNICKFKKKGDYVIVRGSLKNTTYETKDGQKRIVTTIIAQEIGFGHVVKTESKEAFRSEYSKEIPTEESSDLPF